MTDKDDLLYFKRRREIVNEIEGEEMRITSIEKKWQQLNAIIKLAAGLGLFRLDPSEEVVYKRWAKLKEKAMSRPSSKPGQEALAIMD